LPFDDPRVLKANNETWRELTMGRPATVNQRPAYRQIEFRDRQ